jgi:polyisoprenoid-binding protein YceI
MMIQAVALLAAVQTWPIDPEHSFAQFTAKHFGIVPVVGSIPITKGSVQIDPGSEIPAAVSAELTPAGVDTHNDMRDGDLRSPHYLDVQADPAMTFVSTKISGSDPKHFMITGNLTMHGRTHPVTLNVQVEGAGKTPRGEYLIAYGATGTIDRTQWGMSYGPVIVGNDVDLSLSVEVEQP